MSPPPRPPHPHWPLRAAPLADRPLAAAAAAAGGPGAGEFEVKSADGALALALRAGGAGANNGSSLLQSISVNGTATPLHNSGLSLAFGGQTFAVTDGGSAAEPLPSGGVAFRRRLTLAAGRHTASLEERFEPAGDAVAWTLIINGSSPTLWSPSIRAVLQTGSGGGGGSAVWLPWSRPSCSTGASAQCKAVCGGYSSPLEPVPSECLAAAAYGYGSGGSMSASGAQGVSIPLAAMLDTPSDTAFTLSVAPAPNLLSITNTHVDTTARSIGVGFGQGYRVSSGSAALTLRFHITASHACPRDILLRYSQRHAEYFAPPNLNVHYRASGMGSYAATQGPLAQVVDGQPLLQTMQDVGYTVNWDATFWWPYIMMIAPTIAGPDNRTVLWGSALDKETGYNNRLSRVHVKASYAVRDEYYRKWQAANLTVLGYFNGYELGQSMTEYPPKPNSCPPTPELWRSAPCFIHTYLDSALCTTAAGHRNVGPGSSGWDGDTELDPGTTLYRDFLKTQVQNHLVSAATVALATSPRRPLTQPVAANRTWSRTSWASRPMASAPA